MGVRSRDHIIHMDMAEKRLNIPARLPGVQASGQVIAYALTFGPFTIMQRCRYRIPLCRVHTDPLVNTRTMYVFCGAF